MKKAESVKYYVAASVAVAAFIIYLSALKNDFIFWDDDLYIFQNSHIQSLNAAFFKWAFFDFHAGNWHPLTWISHALDYAVWGLNPLGHHLTNNVLHAANTFLVVLVVWRLMEAYRAVIPAKAGIQRFFSSANPPGRGKVTGFRVKPGMTKVRKDSRLGESPGVIGQAGMTENGNLLRNGGTVPSPLGNNLKISPNPCLSDRQASFLKRGTGTPPPLEKGDGGGFSDKMTLIAAATTGLLFGLHPLHVESVAWVSERKDLLCAVFFLLSILSYLKYSETEAFIQTNESNPLPCPPFLKGGKGGLWKSYLLSLVFFILALLSKPMAVTLPLVLLILDWYPLRRINSLKTFKTAFVEKLPFIALSIASSIATVLAQRAGGALETMEVTPLYTRMLVASKSLMAYLWKMVVPLDLNPFYPYPKEASLFSLEYIASIVLVVGITAMCIAAAGKRRLWLSVWGYYVIMLLPVLGIVQVGLQSMADRYMYLPSLGPFLLIGLAGARGWELIERQGKRRSAARILIVSSAVFVIVLLSYATFKQIGIWRSSIVFWSYVVEKEPERIPVAYYNRAIAFDKAGAPARAIADYDKAIALKPSDYKAFNNRGLVFEKMGLLDRAIMDYNEAIALSPSFPMPYNNLGVLYERLRRFDKAVENYNKAISLNPLYHEAYSNLGAAYQEMGLFDKAVENYNKAIALNPLYHQAYYNRGTVYEAIGQHDKAINSYNKAISLNPSLCESYNAMGDLVRQVCSSRR